MTTATTDQASPMALRGFPVRALALLFIGLTFAHEASPFMRGVGSLFLLGLALDGLLLARGVLSRRH